MNTIEMLANDYQLNPKSMECFLEWILTDPANLSRVLRRTIIHSVIGHADDQFSEDITLRAEILNELTMLEYTAQLLYELSGKGASA